jgi:hypothetical protein
MVALLSALLMQFQPEAALGRILPAALSVAPVAAATSYAPPAVDPDRPLFVIPNFYFEPLVAVPGFNPVPDWESRTRAMLLAMERLNIDGVSQVAHFIVDTGVGLQYTADPRGGRNVGLRVRLPVPGM